MENYSTHLMTVRDLAEYLSVSGSLVYKWVEQKQVPHYRLGGERGAIRFDSVQINEWLELQYFQSPDVTTDNAELEKDIDKILSSTTIGGKV